MYITNLTHLLDENGNIAAGMNISGRRMASFLAMIIDHSTAQQEEGMAGYNTNHEVSRHPKMTDSAKKIGN